MSADFHKRTRIIKCSEEVFETIVPMGIGSVIGAVAGGLLVGVVPGSVLKVLLGVILIVSAVRIFGVARDRT